MRSLAWMVAYAAVLVMLGAAWAALAFSGPRVALVIALAALAATSVAVALAFLR